MTWHLKRTAPTELPNATADRRREDRVSAGMEHPVSVLLRAPNTREWSGFLADFSEQGACVLLPGETRQLLAGSRLSGQIVGGGLTIPFEGALVWQRHDPRAASPRIQIGVRFDVPPEGAPSLVKTLRLRALV